METEVEVSCPFCGEPNTIAVQAEEDGDEFDQDFSVCCRHLQCRITIRRDGSAEVTVRPEGG